MKGLEALLSEEEKKEAFKRWFLEDTDEAVPADGPAPTAEEASLLVCVSFVPSDVVSNLAMYAYKFVLEYQREQPRRVSCPTLVVMVGAIRRDLAKSVVGGASFVGVGTAGSDSNWWDH